MMVHADSFAITPYVDEAECEAQIEQLCNVLEHG